MSQSTTYKINNTQHLYSGFTLIELSIVLVIIALVTAGIMGGRSLVNATKIVSILSEVTQYQTAFNTFKLQYDVLPGDMRDGYDYFDDGSENICGGNDNYNHSGCNGDGDGKMEAGEGVRAWYHLQAADILTEEIARYQDGVYMFPSPGTISSDSIRHNNVPLAKSRYNDFTGYTFGGYDYYEDAEAHWFGKTGPWLIYGAGLTSWWINEAGAINQKNASSLDKKGDDGMPGTGNITAINGSDTANPNNEITPGCTLNGMVYFNRDWSGGVNATYNVGEDTVSCVLHFYLGE